MHWIEELCKDYKIRKSELSRRTGISPQKINKWKSTNNNINQITVSDAKSIAKTLKIGIAYLVFKYDMNSKERMKELLIKEYYKNIRR